MYMYTLICLAIVQTKNYTMLLTTTDTTCTLLLQRTCITVTVTKIHHGLTVIKFYN